MKPEPTRPDPVQWETRPLEWPRATGQVDQLLAALEVRRRRQRGRRLAAATAGALAVLALAFFFPRSHPPAAASSVAEATHAILITPERRTLPDGTVVDLRPGAELLVRFTAVSPGARDVALLRGEAYFQVAKDAARPFIVHARGVQFRAVGTAFTVDVAGPSVDLLVTEGRVAVQPRAETTAEVGAGQRVAVVPASPAALAILPVLPDETRERLAWRVPRLEFNETPLREVIRLFNQHSGSHLTLADASLGHLEISGVLRADNPESLLRMLEANYPIAVVRHPDGAITLRSKR